MQPVNDDMDALFRRAADDYPLNTGGADFDALLQKMQQPGDAVVSPPKGQRRNYSWLLLLLLLIPFVCRYYSGNENGNGQPTTTQNNEKTSNPTEDFTTKKNTATAHDSKPESSNTNSGIQLNSQPAAQETATDSKQAVSIDKPANPSFEKAITDSANHLATRHTPSSNRKRKTSVVAKEAASVDKYAAALTDTQKQKHGNSQNGKQKDALKSKATNTVAAGEGTTDTADETGSALSGIKKNTITGKQDSSLAAINKGDTTATAKNKTTPPKDTTTKDSVTTATNKQKKKKEKVNPFFYVGIMGGIDYSVVKSKQTAGTGSNVGLVAGYSFGRHWAIETGFIRAYKKYRSEGEFVDTTGLGLAMHTQLTNVHGACTMFEIPVNVQFHFGNKTRSHWYVGTGVSSYLMKKEQYDYVGKRYNMMYSSEKEYTNSTKNWFSILQFSGGYQVKMGKLGSFRAEPYVKLPLSKIGIASLPLSSAGINIGYTRPL